MTTVTASTSLVLVTTSNLVGSTIVTFPNISTTGRIITVRDNDGFANSSNYIVLRATAGASFGGVSGSLIINQPFGFITLMSQGSGSYSVLNTFAFPTGSTAAFVSNITATNLATLSTMQFQDRATSNQATMFVSGGQIILNNNFIGQITSNQLQSTVTHLGSLGYLSTVPLFASTQIISSLQTNFLSAGGLTVGVFNPANITTTNLTAVSTNVTTGNFRTVSTGALIVSTIEFRSDRLAIGSSAGTNQGQNTIAIGTQAASIGTAQGDGAIAIGQLAGYESQKTAAVAIGLAAGIDNQNANAVAVGTNAGRSIQGQAAIAVGYLTGYQSQGQDAVAIGNSAAYTTQGSRAVAIGFSAASDIQGANAVAIGNNAGFQTQGTSAVAIGNSAGQTTQGSNAVAIGMSAGNNNQNLGAIAIGSLAGILNQSTFAIAIGREAGYMTQGANAVAIGFRAGQTSQSDNTIVLNATGAPLNTTLSNATYIKPIRQDLALNTTKGQLYYTSTTGELTFGPVIVSTFSTVITNSIGIGVANPAYTLDVNGIGHFSNTSSGITSHRAFIGILGISTDPKRTMPFTQFTDGLTSAMPFDQTSYGTVQITRPADQADRRFHLSFIRQGNYMVGMGFLSNTSMWGIQTGGTSNPNGFFADFTNNRFGMNTSNPQFSLDVNGTLNVGSNISTPFAVNYTNTNTITSRITTLFYNNPINPVATRTKLSEIKLEAASNSYCASIGLIQNGYTDSLDLGFFTPRTNNDPTLVERMTIKSGTDGYGGNVGIGTSTPAFKLDVAGQLKVVANGTSSLTNYTTAAGSPDSLIIASPCNAFQGGKASIYFGLNGTATYALGRIVAEDVQRNTMGSYFSQMYFQTNIGGSGNLSTRMMIDLNGRVGIATTSPGYQLDVLGNMNVNQFTSASASSGETLRVGNVSGGRNMRFFTNLNAGNYSGMTAAGDMAIVFSEGSLETGNMWIGPHSGSAKGIKILASGNVGINTATPATSLVVKNTAATALTGLAINSSDVNVIIGNSGGGANNGSIQVTSGGSASAIGSTPYSLNIQPLGGATSFGGDVSIPGTITTSNIRFSAQGMSINLLLYIPLGYLTDANSVSTECYVTGLFYTGQTGTVRDLADRQGDRTNRLQLLPRTSCTLYDNGGGGGASWSFSNTDTYAIILIDLAGQGIDQVYSYRVWFI